MRLPLSMEKQPHKQTDTGQLQLKPRLATVYHQLWRPSWRVELIQSAWIGVALFKIQDPRSKIQGLGSRV